MNGLFYNFKKHGTAAGLNLVGLAAAFAACFVLATQVRFATEYNKCIPEWENVYRIEAAGLFDNEKLFDNISRPMLERIAQEPTVEDFMLIDLGWGSVKALYGERKNDIELYCAEKNGLKMLRPKMLCGVDTLATDAEIILPATDARRIFGDEEALGKTLVVGQKSYQVVGVFEDFPENCIFAKGCYTYLGEQNADNWNNWNYMCYARLKPGTDAESYGEHLTNIFKEMFGMDINCTLSLRPIGETYMSGVDGFYDKGNPGLVLVLQLVFWLLLIVSTINFANFTLAETPMRIKGVNTRKVLGMTNFQLRRDFILETVAVAFLAFLLSLLLIWMLGLSPWILTLVKGSISIGDNLHLIIYIGAAALAIGVLVGIYPAFYATSFPPALVLKGTFGLSPRGVFLRKTLVGVQLFIAFFLTIYLGVLFLQSRYIFNSDYGFAKDELLYTDKLAHEKDFAKVRAELGKIPGVAGVGFTQTMPGTQTGMMRWGRSDNEHKVAMLLVTPVDYNFLKVIGAEIIEGRNFAESDQDCYILNKAARDAFDWVRIDQPLLKNDMPVVGVCNNIRIQTAREDNSKEHAAFVVFGDKYKSWNMEYKIVVRVAANIDKLAVKKQLDAAVEKLFHFDDDYDTSFRFMDDQLQQTYEEEFRFIRQVELFSLICLIVTLVGVFCLTMFETEYRRREIGIRRVLGTTTGEIIGMFALRYVWLILPAFALAAPLAWQMSHDWLENFAERTAVHWWLFLASLLAVTAVVLTTVALQTWRATLTRPMEAIKTG